MIDSHCHLEFEDFDEDRDEVIQKAKGRIEAIVDSCAELDKARQVLRLHRQYPDFIFPCLGLHPSSALKASKKKLEKYKRTIRQKSQEIVAVGEVGLDYSKIKNKPDRQESQEIFLDFIRLSDKLGLPVVVHARDAMKDTLRILSKKEGDVIIHCFSGDLDQLYEALDRDY